MPSEDTPAVIHQSPQELTYPNTEWRHNHEIRQRMEYAAAYHARGLPLTEIAKRLGVSPSTAGRDLARLHTLWKEERRTLANEERRAALAATVDVARTAWHRLETPEVAADPAAFARLLRIVLAAQREARLLADAISKHPDRVRRLPPPDILTSLFDPRESP